MAYAFSDICLWLLSNSCRSASRKVSRRPSVLQSLETFFDRFSSTSSVGLSSIRALGCRASSRKSERAAVPLVGVLKCNLHSGGFLAFGCHKIPLDLRFCHQENEPPTQHRLDRALKL